MESVGQWRLVEPQGEEREDKDSKATADGAATGQRTSLLLVTATVALVVAAAGLAIWATLPSGGATVEQQGGAPGAAFVPQFGSGDDPGEPAATEGAAASSAANVVVDVQGAVTAPGVHELAAGSRVADAIAAAGGYAPSVDIAAASRLLNLAEKLTDGTQIHVPALGEAVAAPAATAAANQPAAGTGLIELNTATADQLDTLPGIGPVTAAKIIDARSEAPFASVDELLARGVVGASTFEKIRDLVTVAP